MRKECAWCGKVLEDDPNDEWLHRDGTPMISHGICAPCADMEFGKLDDDVIEDVRAEGLE